MSKELNSVCARYAHTTEDEKTNNKATISILETVRK